MLWRCSFFLCMTKHISQKYCLWPNVIRAWMADGTQQEGVNRDWVSSSIPTLSVEAGIGSWTSIIMALLDLPLSYCFFLSSKGEIGQMNCVFKFLLIDFNFFLSQAAFQIEFKSSWEQPDKTGRKPFHTGKKQCRKMHKIMKEKVQKNNQERSWRSRAKAWIQVQITT